MVMDHIDIIGAGIGGLTSALCLRRAGFDVTVFERADKLSEFGAGIQLGPNALHVLHELEMTEALNKLSVHPTAIKIKDYKTGRVLLNVKLGTAFMNRYGQNYIHIHRADLQKALFDTAIKAGVTIKFGHDIKTVSDMSQITIACDGIRSSLRSALFDREPPQFSGRIAWRASIVSSNLNVTLPKETYNWVGPGGHVVAYYIRGGSVINIVAVRDTGARAAESWVEPGKKSELLKAFQDWDPTLKELLKNCDQIFKWGLYDRPPLKVWTKGSVTLLGDAAHPMLPFMAQGAAMAIEDAWVLAHFLKTNPSKSGLKHFENARRPRTTQLQKMSRQNADMYHATGQKKVWRDLKLTLGNLIKPLQDLQLDRVYKTNVVKDYPIDTKFNTPS